MEAKYHSYELETLAVVETIKKYRVYLLGIRFKVVTDCNSLKTAATKKDLVPRIGRWWLQLQEFTLEIEHRPGTKMAYADALSRNSVTTTTETIAENFILRIDGDNWLLAGQ